MDIPKLTLILIGDSAVGKTHMLTKFAHKQDPVTMTIGLDFVVRRVLIKNEPIKVHIWDTAGQERFHAITRSYYNIADGAALVFDLNKRSSFEHLEYWLYDIKGRKDLPMIVIGNKKDLDRTVTIEEAQTFADKHGLYYFETSIDDLISIEIAFYDLLNQVYIKENLDVMQLEVEPEPIQACMC